MITSFGVWPGGCCELPWEEGLSMRMAYYPGTLAYPSWVKAVLVSIGAMFVASSAFLIILIWRSEPLAGQKTRIETTSAVAPALTAAAGPAAAAGSPSATAEP